MSFDLVLHKSLALLVTATEQQLEGCLLQTPQTKSEEWTTSARTKVLPLAMPFGNLINHQAAHTCKPFLIG